MKFFLLLFFFLALSGNVRAQEEQEMDASPALHSQNPSNSEAPLEHYTDEDEEKLLQELSAAKAKQAETALKIEKAKDDFSNVGTNALAQFQKSGEVSLAGLGKMDEKTIAYLQKTLKDAHMDQIPAQKVRETILAKTEGKPLGKLFKSYPKLLDISVDIVRDAEALPAMVGILGKQEKLKTYFYVWLGLFILSFLIKRYIFPKTWLGFKRFFAGMIMSLLFLSVSLSVFYQLFEKELAPIFRVLKNHF